MYTFFITQYFKAMSKAKNYKSGEVLLSNLMLFFSLTFEGKIKLETFIGCSPTLFNLCEAFHS